MTEEPLPPDLEVDLPLPDGLKVTTDRPYRILYVADLAGADGGSLSGPLAERVAEVDPESFDALLAGARPTVRFKTTDPLSTGNVLAEVELRFDSLKAFQPKALLQQIPATRPLLEAREQIVARLRGKLSADQFKESVKRLSAGRPELAWLPDAIHWVPSAAPAPENVVDDLLGQLDLGGDGGQDEGRPPPKTPIGKMIAKAAGSGPAALAAPEASALRRALGEIDRRASAWLGAVLHAPPVQNLEAAWRALAFLVSHLEFRKGLRLSVLHTPHAALTQRLVSLVIDPVFDAGAEAPALLVVDSLFTNTAADVEILDELAQHGASVPAVVLAGVSPEFLGVKHAWQIPTLPAIVSLFDQWQFAKWKTLRGQPYARALGVVFGRCLLREPSGGSPADDLDFVYREECLADKDCVWASGTVAAACTIARSVAETGWPTGLVGRLDGFAIGQGGKKGEKQFGPADTQISLDKAQELAVGGINVVMGVKNQAQVLVCNGFSVARPGRAAGFAMLEVSLPYQLFAGRLSSLLLDLKPNLVGMAQEKLAAFVLAHVRQWLTLEGLAPDEQQIAVQARPAEGPAEGLQLAVTVTPPPQILPGGVPVVLGYRVS